MFFFLYRFTQELSIIATNTNTLPEKWSKEPMVMNLTTYNNFFFDV